VRENRMHGSMGGGWRRGHGYRASRLPYRPGRGFEKGVDEEKVLSAGIIGAVNTPIGPSQGAPFQCSHHPTLWIVWG